MKFSVIYEVDLPRGVKLAVAAPPRCRAWRMTEGDENREYDYLGDDWAKGKHRKWGAVLTKKQFERFLDHTGLFMEDVETGGALGAPGCGFGLSPAVAFTSDDPEYIACAYVTPLPDVEPKRAVDAARGERVWQRIVVAMWHKYGTGGQHRYERRRAS
jgi:hypothetical protein